MNFQTLRYLLHYRNFKESRRLRLPQMGFGIECRRKALSPFWEPHLDKCRSAQKQWCQSFVGQNEIPKKSELIERSLTVLGAGRLFDLDCQVLSSSFSPILLLDADPFCIPYWEKWKAKSSHTTEISWAIAEVSGLIDDWRASLEDRSRTGSWDDVMKVLEEIDQLDAKTK